MSAEYDAESDPARYTWQPDDLQEKRSAPGSTTEMLKALRSLIERRYDPQADQ